MSPLLLAFSCLPVDGPKLLARHFAAAVAEFAQLPPDVDMGYAPMPGAIRRFLPEELTRLGTKNGLAVAGAKELCFAWRMTALDPEQATAAMRASLPPEARLEVIELSRAPVPEGGVHFPLELLKKDLWRGYVQYDPTRKHEVWARVRVTVRHDRVVAAVPLKAGERLGAAQLRVEQVDAAPDSQHVARLEDAIGLIARRPFAAGMPLSARMLDKPAAVERGDTVRLRAIAGAAQITIEVQATASGKPGDLIAVKNLSSGRMLRARVERAGEVTLAQ